MKKRIEITIETERLLVVARRKSSALAWCALCARHVKMVTPDEATILADVSTRKIYRWIESAKLHFIKSPDGSLLICLNSLCVSKAQRESRSNSFQSLR